MGGTQRGKGRNRESRSREAAGRRNYPGAVAQEKEWQKKGRVTGRNKLSARKAARSEPQGEKELSRGRAPLHERTLDSGLYSRV